MSTSTDLRERKRLALRQSISDAASRLFVENGFDNVTVDQIAAAADVSRKTVFNHFPKKEDMFFDLAELGVGDLAEAFRTRDSAVPALEWLRRAAHKAVEGRRPYVRFLPESKRFFETVEASATLKARAREMRDELAAAVAVGLADAAGKSEPDADAKLAAALLVAAWATGLLEGHRVFQVSHDQKLAQDAILSAVDRAALAISAALKGTPYAPA